MRFYPWRLRRLRLVAFQGKRQINLSIAVAEIVLVKGLEPFEVAMPRVQSLRQHRHPILLSLTIPDNHLMLAEIEVLHPQPKALHQPQPCAIEETAHQPFGILQMTQHSFNSARVRTKGKRDGRLERSTPSICPSSCLRTCR